MAHAERPKLGGVTTVSLLVVILIGTVVGALVGLVLGGSVSHVALAIIAGLAATLVGSALRNVLVYRKIGVGTNDPPSPQWFWSTPQSHRLRAVLRVSSLRSSLRNRSQFGSVR